MYYREMVNCFSSKFNCMLTNEHFAILIADYSVAGSLKSHDLSRGHEYE